MKKFRLILLFVIIGMFSCDNDNPADSDDIILYSLAGADTRVVFNESVDLRYAWLGNDAETASFENEILNLINSATATIDVTTMTFTKMNIAVALANRAAAGIDIRIIGAGFRRWQPGYWRALAGGAVVVDDNLPALVHKVNFQDDATAVGDYYIDRGDAYGMRYNGVSYGWNTDKTAKMLNHNMFPSSLIDDSYVQPNSETAGTWEIEVPNGYYYVHLMVGQANNSYHPKNYITVEGQTVLFTSSGFKEYFYTNTESDHSDLFRGCAVDIDDARRIHVTDGRLSVQVGKAGQSSYSSLAYIEIYRADQVSASGDQCRTDNTDDEIQERQLQHTKYILIDRNSTTPTLWSGSGNLTQSMDYLSEDAIISTNAGLCATFIDHFNQQWGSNTITPDKANSNFGLCKSVTPGLNHTINGFNWKVRFSPSISGTGGYDIGVVARDFIQNSNHDLVMVLEQFRPSSSFLGYLAPSVIWNTTIPNKLANPNYELYAVGGDEFDTNPWNTYPNASVAFVPRDEAPPVDIHNKYVLTDAINDSRYTRRGKVLCGSMNWSQSGMHSNDEQTLIIENPYIANQYLQHAAKRMQESGIPINKKADIILIIDRSFSMNGPNHDGTGTKLEAAKDAAKLFLDIIETDEQHHVNLIRFGETVEPYVPAITLANYDVARKNILKLRVDDIMATTPIGNWTCYGLPLADAKTQFTNSTSNNPRKIIHFFTDGRENKAPNAITEYPALAAMGVEIHSSGFGVNAISNILEDMATASTGSYEQVPLNTLDLKKRFAEVARDAMDLATVLDPRFRLSVNESFDEQVYIDKWSTKVKFVFSWEGNQKEPIDIEIITPDGYALTTGNGVSFTWSDAYLVVDVKHLDSSNFKMEGNWKISCSLKEANVSALYTDLIVYSDSDIRLTEEVIPFSSKDLENVILLARLLENGQPVVKNNITVELFEAFKDDNTRNHSTITLYDDGKHSDQKPGDGLFGIKMKLKTPGNYTMLFISNGMAFSGNSVRRDARVNYNWGFEQPYFKNYLKEFQININEQETTKIIHNSK